MALSIAAAPSTTGRLFFLDLRAGRVLCANPDGSDLKVLLEGNKTGMDGIVVDPAARHIFWTNMGKMKADDGSIERLDLDGKNLTMVVPAGGTFTPKQLKPDKKSGKLYWSAREGMRAMRSNPDGPNMGRRVGTGRGAAPRPAAEKWSTRLVRCT